MRTILSQGGYFVISGPDTTSKHEKEAIKNEKKAEVFIQSVQYTEPVLADLVWAIQNECFSNLNHTGLDLEVESIVIHLTATDGKKYDLNISEAVSLEEYQEQVLEQIKI